MSTTLFGLTFFPLVFVCCSFSSSLFHWFRYLSTKYLCNLNCCTKANVNRFEVFLLFGEVWFWRSHFFFYKGVASVMKRDVCQRPARTVSQQQSFQPAELMPTCWHFGLVSYNHKSGWRFAACSTPCILEEPSFVCPGWLAQALLRAAGSRHFVTERKTWCVTLSCSASKGR